MKNIQVKPLESINGIEFGLNREKVRELLGNYTEFKKSKYSKNTTDDFGFCHVYYNTLNKCEAFEFFGNDIVICLGDKQVYPSSFSNFKQIITDLEEESGSYISKSMSIGVTLTKGNIESILFAVKDYYK